MRIHHLNCITTCPLGGRLMSERSRGVIERAELACHCVLLELDSELVLIDTGLGLRDVADPRSRLSQFFLILLAPKFRQEMTAHRQIERMGLDPGDVTHIILTHLDFDHAGGLDDFPDATVHLLERERAAATAQASWLDRQRFRPQQWSSIDRWRTYVSGEGESWFDFDCVRDLDGLPPEILMVPLLGHTFGHSGVAVRRDSGSWILMAGDAYFDSDEMDLEAPSCAPGLRLYQTMMDKDRRTRLWNQGRLRDLVRERGNEVSVFCSHDPFEFEAMAGRPLTEPAASVGPGIHDRRGGTRPREP